MGSPPWSAKRSWFRFRKFSPHKTAGALTQRFRIRTQSDTHPGFDTVKSCKKQQYLRIPVQNSI